MRRRAGYSSILELIETSLTAQANHFFDEDRFLLCIQARKQRLGSIGDIPLIHRTVVEKLRFIAHLLDNIVRGVALRPRNAKVQTVGTVVAKVVHRAIEACPVPPLFRRELKLRFDPLYIRIAGGNDLLSGERLCCLSWLCRSVVFDLLGRIRFPRII